MVISGINNNTSCNNWAKTAGTAALATSAALFADDLTGIGIADDPLAVLVGVGGLALLAISFTSGCGGEGGAEIDPAPVNLPLQDSGTVNAQDAGAAEAFDSAASDAFEAGSPDVIDSEVSEATDSQLPDAADSGKTLIDPSKDCTDYPADKILSEITIAYNAGVPEVSGERDKIKEILTKIPYQIPQGIESINIVDAAIGYCSYKPGIVGYYDRSTFELFLCKDLSGKSGAFENNDTLTWVLTHEVGHHVEDKIPGHIYGQIITSLIEENYNCTSQNYSECFAEIIPTYVYQGPVFKLKLPKTYDHVANNLFCNKSYDEPGLCRGYIALGSYYEDKMDYDKAIENFNKAVNFPDLTPACIFNGYSGLGNSYKDKGDCQNAADSYLQGYNHMTNDDDRAYFLYQAATTYEECSQDMSSAITYYSKIMDEFPQSEYACSAMIALNYIYFKQSPSNWNKIIETSQIFISGYSAKDDCLYWAYYKLVNAYLGKNECNNAASALNYVLDNFNENNINYDPFESVCSVASCLSKNGDCASAIDLVNKYNAASWIHHGAPCLQDSISQC